MSADFDGDQEQQHRGILRDIRGQDLFESIAIGLWRIPFIGKPISIIFIAIVFFYFFSYFIGMQELWALITSPFVAVGLIQQ